MAIARTLPVPGWMITSVAAFLPGLTDEGGGGSM